MIARACYAVAYLIWKAGTFVAVKWERAFVLSCIAVSLDPLFLYIPIVDETNKCLNMDKTLRTTALVLRTLTDFLLLTHIVAEICQCIQDQKDKEYYLSTDKYLSTDYPKYLSEDSNPHSEYDKEFDRDPEALCIYPVKSFVDTNLPWLTPSVIIKLLAIIPVPQVAILRGFFRMTGSDFYVIRKFLNIALVLQYLPRVCQIYLTKRQFRMGGKWPQPLFNLYLYILAGHVSFISTFFIG
ncbi:hypothetical protein RchiOBHm_Chr5g0019821 [Rosa chinensis]|uniref:Ion transport domain-containing protein n=1 Tax=Rosa chinensis TaxID=74649 RepID=A0A2P6Q729_ROSCH|nr:hypothetical protein RchiOBHm_Chr5g0019821 [Rosa chinensis]